MLEPWPLLLVALAAFLAIRARAGRGAYRMSMTATPNPIKVDLEGGHVYRRLGWDNAQGYRSVSIDGQTRLVHRVVWEAAHGPIPPGMTINHLNGNRLDNRLVNLECVSQADNNKHAREVLGHDPGGGKRSRGEGHWASRLTEGDVTEIRRRAGEGESCTALAAEFGITKSTAARIVRREMWAHVVDA